MVKLMVSMLLFSCFAYSQVTFKQVDESYSKMMTFDEHLEFAKSFYKNKFFFNYREKGIIEINKALKINPFSSEALAYKGMLMWDNAQLYSIYTFNTLSESIDNGTQIGCVYYYRARTRMDLIRYDDPRADISKICADLLVAKTLGLSECPNNEKLLEDSIFVWGCN
jgi:hypothetical protein